MYIQMSRYVLVGILLCIEGTDEEDRVANYINFLIWPNFINAEFAVQTIRILL